ncbi:MAG TPA: ATP-binding cassette domain-containing protein, partial [Chthonomonadaceae bacterium]|nr:ATP-binding cassette domain-containing protein [Chthonomonadaceae bacterium]
MISVENVSKQFTDKRRGVIRAVDGVSFAAEPGEIFGLLGPNGAGKTTLLRILATILAPTSGTAVIAGCDIVRDAAGVRRHIGYLSGGAGLYERLTGRQVLRYFATLYGLRDGDARLRIDRLIDELDMSDYIDGRCDKYSTGQKQRVSIARAVIHDPPILFLDEPTSGLDLIAARTVIRYIRDACADGKCIIFSTHIMSEVEALCSRIAIIYEGRVAGIGT